MFECKSCEYNTKKISNFNRHIKTQKHINICGINNENIFICNICNKEFKRKWNLTRHKETICNNVIKNNNILIQKVIDKVDNLESNLINQNIEQNNKINNKIDTAVRSASSLIRYLIENHKNAPVLKQLTHENVLKTLKITHGLENIPDNDEDKESLYSDSDAESIISSDCDDLSEENKKFLIKHKATIRKKREKIKAKKMLALDPKKFKLQKEIIKNYKLGSYIEYICNAILKNIKKENIKEQSIFNTDYSRLNYAIKISKRIWNDDKAGAKFIKLVISPTLQCINKLLDEYRTHLSNKYDLMKNDIYLNDTDEFQNIMKNIFEIYEIQAKTMSENTIKQIIKDLAPQLRYIKQNDKQDNTNSTNSTNSDESDDE